MDPLSLTANIVAILSLTSIVVDYINDIRDSRKERIRLRNEITNAIGPLYMICDRIKREQERMKGDPAEPGKSLLSSVIALGAPAGPLEQFREVLQELERRLASPQGTLSRLGQTLAWPFQKHDIERFLLVIERKKSLFQLALENDHMTLTQAVQDDTKLIPKIASDVAEVVIKIDGMETTRENRAIIDWLSPLNFFRTHDSIFARRTPDTGQWFLDSHEYLSWVDSIGGRISCQGIPGAGKTLMSSIVVNDLRDRFENVAGTRVASVYCDYREQFEQTPVNLLAGLWFQLIHSSDKLSDDVKKLYRKHMVRDTLPSLTEVEKVLSTEIGRCQKVFIVIDALDECLGSSQTDLLRSLQSLRPKVNLLVTSRSDSRIAQALENCSRLRIEASDEDVLTYVSSRVSGQLARHIGRDPSLAAEIKNAVAGKAQKMFLLAQLQLDSLQEKSSPKAVRKALATLPSDLDRMYDETLLRNQNQSEDYKQLAEQILQWIVFAVRPLSVNELQEALAVEENTEQIDESNFVDPELFTSVCAGLVVHDQVSGIVRLVHASTQEYFKRIRFDRFPDAQIQIGRACLTYLSFQEFEARACSHDLFDRPNTQKYHLLRYAAEHWGEHCCGDSEGVMQVQILEFLGNEKKVSNAVQVMHFAAPTRFPKVMSRLHLAAHFGLENTVNVLLTQGDDILARDDFGASALHKAAEAGHENLVRLLLEHGADIEGADLKGHSAIHRATISEKTGTVRLLLEKDARVLKAIDGRTPLHFAAEAGNEEIVTALLEVGGEVNAETYIGDGDHWQMKFFAGRTPLHWAAQNGHVAVARVLLEHGAKVNALNSTKRTPLQEAIMFWHAPMVRHLLENGASVTIKNEDGWTPLHEAAWQAPSQIAEMLLDHGAEIDPTNIYTPPDAKLLGVETKDDEVGREPFHLATYMQIHRTEYAVDLNPTNISTTQDATLPEYRLNKSEVGCTPLHLAVARGEFDVFEVLKSHGANVEFRDASGLVPLHRTVQASRSNGSLRIMRSLLDAGVDIEVKDERRQETTLQMAARLGKLDCVKCLLERGANMEATNGFGKNALQLAEAGGHVEVAKVLTQHASRH